MAPTKDTAPKTYSFAKAKTVLSDVEKNRLICLFLHCDQASIDWAKATEAFECKSVESMRVMTRGTLKKIVADDGTGSTSASAAAPTKAGGKKREAAAAEEGDDEEAEAPVKKSKGKGKAGVGGKKKKADTPVDDEKVKAEDGEDEENEF